MKKRNQRIKIKNKEYFGKNFFEKRKVNKRTIKNVKKNQKRGRKKGKQKEYSLFTNQANQFSIIEKLNKTKQKTFQKVFQKQTEKKNKGGGKREKKKIGKFSFQ